MTPHFVNCDGIRDLCIQLYCLISSPCPQHSEDDPLLGEYVNLYRYKLSNLLLEIATRARVLDDILRNDESEYALAARRYDDVVGSIVIGGEGELKLRSCLNKIIHASWVRLVAPGMDDVWDDEEEMCRKHTGDVLLEGEQGGKKWTVQLSLIPLCRELLTWLPDVEEMSRLRKLYQ
jgi:hypothetical protein